jgi:heme/copper-type cytochrome/quinol oxidase subunit 3
LQSHAPVDDHAVHEHHPRQQHHFDTMAHQYEASSFGMWVFLIQEVMFFGGLFVAYLVYRNMYYNAFGTASESLNVTLGLFNTVVLIGSSLTMAFAVNAAQLGRKKLLILYILATMPVSHAAASARTMKRSLTSSSAGLTETLVLPFRSEAHTNRLQSMLRRRKCHRTLSRLPVARSKAAPSANVL